MSDNLGQLDQGGSNCQWTRAYLGPTLGWAMLPVMPELKINSAAALVISPYSSRVLLNAAVVAVTLPDVSQWLLASLPKANTSAFDRSLWVKDLAGNWAANNCVFTPFGSQTIDGGATYTGVSNHALVRFYPLTDLTGWYVG